jgi:hypothetical protein
MISQIRESVLSEVVPGKKGEKSGKRIFFRKKKKKSTN